MHSKCELLITVFSDVLPYLQAQIIAIWFFSSDYRCFYIQDDTHQLCFLHYSGRPNTQDTSISWIKIMSPKDKLLFSIE